MFLLYGWFARKSVWKNLQVVCVSCLVSAEYSRRGMILYLSIFKLPLVDFLHRIVMEDNGASRDNNGELIMKEIGLLEQRRMLLIRCRGPS